ncbi:GNAT family N-acetyltransferase [Bacillus sp. ISL-34]|uniref:GNAT family N-acetyltransferase n=1 Tax=Bacillus sp. ISL-34 TaxID=2819121 RepID=UPI001BE5C9DE|nr:GNAT family N-acetyltransferase [Bacillus sp. ISL-34]MBT2649034.1 GNAT family N-acetyltransferase [Bacillus sp. ISL-34]
MTTNKLSTIQIRKVEKGDIPQLLPLIFNYIVDFYQCPRPSEEALTEFVNEIYNDSSKGLQFIAEKDKKIVGFATLYFTYNTLEVKRIAILHDLFVIPECRRENVGQTLFESCLTYIRENRFAYMLWETAQDNVKAQTLYDKMGGQKNSWLQYQMS